MKIMFFFFNTPLLLNTPMLYHLCDTFSDQFQENGGYCAVVFSKSTQSNIILLLKKGNHGNDIFQVGDSLDRHAFKAPFVSSWKWIWDSTEFTVGKEDLSGCCFQHSRKEQILLHDLKYRI